MQQINEIITITNKAQNFCQHAKGVCVVVVVVVVAAPWWHVYVLGEVRRGINRMVIGGHPWSLGIPLQVS